MKKQAIAHLPEGAQEHLGRIEFSNSLLVCISDHRGCRRSLDLMARENVVAFPLTCLAEGLEGTWVGSQEGSR